MNVDMKDVNGTITENESIGNIFKVGFTTSHNNTFQFEFLKVVAVDNVLATSNSSLQFPLEQVIGLIGSSDTATQSSFSFFVDAPSFKHNLTYDPGKLSHLFIYIHLTIYYYYADFSVLVGYTPPANSDTNVQDDTQTPSSLNRVGGLSGGAAAGIAIGIVAAISIVVAIVGYIRIIQRKKALRKKFSSGA
jgi:hypothetical protein